jgi:histone deacetylase 11
MPLFFLPAFLLRWRVLDPMLTATEGSILAVCSALRFGWSVNLSGGFHHASFDRGGGFCVYPDISLAVHYLRTRLGVRRVMVVDLDAHQGNGHERDHLGDPDLFTFDAYNHHVYPNDREAARAIRRDIAVQSSTTT